MSLPLVLNADEIDNQRLSGLKLVDLRTLEAYQQSHIPGAIHLDANLLNRKEGNTGGLLPDSAGADKLARSIGLSKTDTLLAYDNGGASTAARLIWVLHAFGFQQISMLNGGFQAWLRAGREVSKTAHDVSDGNDTLHFTAGNMLSVDDVLTQGLDQYTFFDVRSAAEFNGTDVRAARGGHVPNAIHSEWTNVFDEHGALKDDDTLRAMMQQLAIQNDQHVVVYCQTHQRSAMTYVVLKHLGYDKVSAIDGAWSAWGNRDDTPVV